MKKRLLSLVILSAAAAIAHADDLLGPADYMKIMMESKITYRVGMKPAAHPLPQMHCDRRDASTRVVRAGNEKKLVEWTVKPEAETLVREAEPFFQNQQYEEAAKRYQHAIEIDPEAAVAYFDYGDTLLWGKHDPAAALAQYQKGIALDPTLSMGYFFTATAYMRLGRIADSREAIVKALAMMPSYESVWKVAEKTPQVWGARPVVRHRFEPPAGLVGAKDAKGAVEVYVGANGEWLGYATCKAAWANEPRFEKERGGDGVSMEEERACVLNQLMGAYNSAEGRLEEQEKQRGNAHAKIDEKAIAAALPPLERHLLDAMQSKLIDGYVLFEIIGQRCPIAMSLASDAARAQLEQYIRKYIIVPQTEGQ